MNSPQSIWSDKPMSTGIAALVCYAGVFNDVIDVEEMASRLGVSGQDEFYATVNELHRQNRIIVRDGFVALPNLDDRISVKAEKIAFTKKLIDSRIDDLRKLGRNPLIKFVGISGSLAANNPTRDMLGRLDLDVFLITRRHCLWIYRILFGIRYVFPKNREEPELCINYLVDEAHLAIPIKNFYTATEIQNLIPVTNASSLRQFLQANSWVRHYYPRPVDTKTTSSLSQPESTVDKLLYFIFISLRCVKWMSFKPLKQLSFKSDPHRGESPCASRNPHGGYHALVQKKFDRLAKDWYSDLLGDDLIEKLFPDELSIEIREGKSDVEAMAQAAIGAPYGKYG
ncbi:MAG: hypothetical protein QM715_04920 [Nibricoccus sp.]